MAPRSRNPPTGRRRGHHLLITVFARPTPVRSRLRARQQSQSSPDPAGKDSATSSLKGSHAVGLCRRLVGGHSQSRRMVCKNWNIRTVYNFSQHYINDASIM